MSWISESLNQYKKPLILIFIAIFSILALTIAFKSYGKDYVTEIINNLVKEQVKIIDTRYAEEIKARADQIQILQNKLLDSEKIYTDLKKRVGNVEQKIKDRKLPVSGVDLRDRFNQLDYKPVN